MWGWRSTHVVHQATLGARNGKHKYRNWILMLLTKDICDDIFPTQINYVKIYYKR